MRILYPAAYFYPENIAFSHMEKDLLQALTDAGHEIVVVCPTPTRGLSDEMWQEYRNKREESLYGGKVHIRRFRAPREGRNALTRAFRYFWCVFETWRTGRRVKNIDLVLAVSTPPIQGLAAIWLKKAMRSPAVYIVQDLFPESLVSTGLSHQGSLIWRVGNLIATYTYSKIEKLIVISETFRRTLLERGVPDKKIQVIYNWVNAEQVIPVSRALNPLYERFNIDKNRFIVLYAGNLGESQNGVSILDAAALLQKESNISFVIFGGGSEYEPLREKAAREGLRNIFFHPLLSQEQAGNVYSIGNVAIISCKPGTGKAGMPSKLWTIMATGTPILASFDTDSELADIIREAQCGEIVNPANPKFLADAIRSAFQAHTRLAEQGRNGRAYVEEHAGKASITVYLRVIEDIAAGRQDGEMG